MWVWNMVTVIFRVCRGFGVWILDWREMKIWVIATYIGIADSTRFKEWVILRIIRSESLVHVNTKNHEIQKLIIKGCFNSHILDSWLSNYRGRVSPASLDSLLKSPKEKKFSMLPLQFKTTPFYIHKHRYLAIVTYILS